MKKIVIILNLLATQVIYAQTEKGKFLLGASVNYSQNKTTNEPASVSIVTNESKGFNFNENLGLGYFFANNFAAGITVGHTYSSSSTKTTNSDPMYPGTRTNKNTGNKANLGLFARAYKLFAGNKFGFFGELSATYITGKSNGTGTDSSPTLTLMSKSSNTTAGFAVGLRPGFTYFITKKIGLEVMVGNMAFTNQKSTFSSEGQKISTTTSSNFNFNLSASTLYLGATFYLGGKKN